MVEYIRILYDRFKRAFGYDNWIGIDDSGIYYIDSGTATGHVVDTYEISSKNTEFIAFNYIIHADFASSDTVFVAGTTGDNANAGTYAAPKKTLKGAAVVLDADHWQICIIEDGYYEGITINEATLPVQSFKLFTSGLITAILYKNTTSLRRNIIENNGSGDATDISIYNIIFNQYEVAGIIFSNSVNINIYFCEAVGGISYIIIDYKKNITSWNSSLLTSSATTFDLNTYNSFFFMDNFCMGMENLSFKKNYNCIFIISKIFDDEDIFSSADIQETIFFNCDTIDFNFNIITISKTIFLNTSIININNIIFSYNLSNTTLLTGTGNIIDSPNFIQNSPVNPEDFQLRLKVMDYIDDSPAYLTGNIAGTENIGAWQGTPIALYSFRKYDIQVPPEHLLTPLLNVGYKAFPGSGGNIETVKDGTKRTIAIIYGENILTAEDDVCFLDYISSRSMFRSDDPLNVVQDDLIIKVFPDIDNSKCYGSVENIENKIVTVSNIIFNDGEKGLVNTDNFRHDQFTGYIVWLKIAQVYPAITIIGNEFELGVPIIENEYAGYWVCIWNNTSSKMIYHIISNTITHIILEDYYNYLEDGNYNYFIFKKFRIDKMIDNTFTVYDPDNQIPDNVSEYKIQCINAVSTNTSMNYQIIGYVKNNVPGYPRTAITRTFQQV